MELLLINKENIGNPKEKRTKNMNRQATKKKHKWLTNMKGCSSSLD